MIVLNLIESAKSIVIKNELDFRYASLTIREIIDRMEELTETLKELKNAREYLANIMKKTQI